MAISPSLNNKIKNYIDLLNSLYQEKELVFGVDTTPLNIKIPNKFMNHLLYYADGKLTDKFYIKNVVTSPTFKKEGPVYCIGEINVGDYICTSEMYGVAMKAMKEEVAFAKVTNIYNIYENDKNEYMNVRLVDVKFL